MNDDNNQYDGSYIICPSFPVYKNITISCGKGTISISTETGKVTLNNCEVDDAAKSFWNAVEMVFPGSVKSS